MGWAVVSGVFDQIFGGMNRESGTDALRKAMATEAARRDEIESGFKHGVKCAAKCARESGNEQLALRIENLKLLRKK
jgi:hypothetical protein